MARIYAQDVIEVGVQATFGTIPIATVVHLFNDEVGGDDASKVEDFANNWQDHVVPLMNSDYKVQGYNWRSLDPDDTNVGTLSPPTTHPSVGGSVGTAQSPNVAFLVHKNTQNRPRGARDGRMFLVGPSEANVDNFGNVLPAAVSAWNTALQALWDGITDSPGNLRDGSGMCVLETTPESRIKGTQPVTLQWRKVTSLTLDAKVATQRDRLR